MQCLHIERFAMRTNIEIDDELMQEAMVASKTSTKKAAVEAALKLMVQMDRQGKAIESLRGKMGGGDHDDDWFASDEEILAKRKKALAGEAAAQECEKRVEGLPLAGE